MKKITDFEKEYFKKKKILLKTAKKIKRYFNNYIIDKDNEWIRELEKNPYECMNIDGFGFKRCDNIAYKIGFDMNSPIRIEAYIVYAVEKNSNGDTILEVNKIINSIEKDLYITDKSLIIDIVFKSHNGYVLLNDKYRVITKEDVENGAFPIYISLNEWYQAEKFIYEWAKCLNKTPRIEKKQDIIDEIIKNGNLNQEQNNIVQHILDENFNLLIGVAGGGKTYTTNKIIQILEKHKLTYTILAPTGIASFNLSEKTQRECKTIHRHFYQGEIINSDYVIIDEFGMCGCSHINLLKQMIKDKTKTRVIFIGDKYQLPSISAGDFLSSIIKLIENKILKGNVFELTHIMRAKEDSYIPHLCNMFTGNNKFDSGIMTDCNLKGVKFYDRQFDLFSQIENIIKVNKWNFKDTAIIMPQRKGEYGCDNFNMYMQSLNNSKIFYEDKFKKFKANDILMHIKNNADLNIYNGEMVEIIDKQGNDYIIKRLYDGSEIEYDEDTLKEQLSLSYANTVHKVQGCTIKNVIFVAIQEHSFMLSRNLVYVGMSRASDNLIVICDKDTLTKSSFKTLTDKRKTFLNLLCL